MTKILFTALLFLALSPLLRAAEPNADQFAFICSQAQDMDSTPEGKAYETDFSDAIKKDMQKALKSCAERTKPPYVVNMVFVIAPNGKVEHVFADPAQPVSGCMAGKLDREKLPQPPKGHDHWLLLVNINIQS